MNPDFCDRSPTAQAISPPSGLQATASTQTPGIAAKPAWRGPRSSARSQISTRAAWGMPEVV